MTSWFNCVYQIVRIGIQFRRINWVKHFYLGIDMLVQFCLSDSTYINVIPMSHGSEGQSFKSCTFWQNEYMANDTAALLFGC